MSSFVFCSQCADARGHSPAWDVASNNYTGTPYQQGKFFDHTISGRRPGPRPVSVLRDPTYGNYKRLMSETIESGFYETDALGRTNIIGKRSMDIGDKLRGLFPYQTQDLFKVVKPETPTGVHGFSYKFPGTGVPLICVSCGRAF